MIIMLWNSWTGDHNQELSWKETWTALPSFWSRSCTSTYITTTMSMHMKTLSVSERSAKREWLSKTCQSINHNLPIIRSVYQSKGKYLPQPGFWLLDLSHTYRQYLECSGVVVINWRHFLHIRLEQQPNSKQIQLQFHSQIWRGEFARF